jgi:hypothetical protein
MYTHGIFSDVLMQVLVRAIKRFMAPTESIFVHNSKLQQSLESWAQTINIVMDICGP